MADPAEGLAGRIRAVIRRVEGFPGPGVGFFDIGPVIADPKLLRAVVDGMASPFETSSVTHVLGLEARGLYFAGAIAARLGAGLVPIRKPGKLPPEVFSATGTVRDDGQVAGLSSIDPSRPSTYRKAYRFEMAANVLGAGARVLIVDDLLAKGGSCDACIQLARRCGAEVVGAAFVIELGGLCGRDRLGDVEAFALLTV